MQFAVPQFIDIEDRIVGPLTLKQFLFLAGSAGIIFILVFVLEPFLFFIVAPLILAVGLTLAFYKVNGRDFAFFLNSVINYFIKPRFYIWKKLPPKPVDEKEVVLPKTEKISPKKIAKSKLKRLAWQLDIKQKADQR